MNNNIKRKDILNKISKLKLDINNCIKKKDDTCIFKELASCYQITNDSLKRISELSVEFINNHKHFC